MDAIEGGNSRLRSGDDTAVLEDEDDGAADELQQWDKRFRTGSKKQMPRRRSKHDKR